MKRSIIIFILLVSSAIFCYGGGPYANPFVLTAGYVDFINYPAAPAHNAGRLFYDSANGCVAMYPDLVGPTLQLGQEQWIRGQNHSGVTIPNGAAVYIYHPDTGNKPYIALAKADAASTSSVIGIATQDIAQGAEGFITTLGLVHDVDTSGFDAGSNIYLSATTAGSFTQTIPTPPNACIIAGKVIKSNANNGIIFATIRPNGSLVQATFMDKMYVTSIATFADGVVLANISEYTDNADAISNGLTVGRLYRTGDTLKVVH